MNKDPLKKIKLENKLKNWVQLTIKDENEKQAFLNGLSNLSEKQLFQLVNIILSNPNALNIIAKQAYQKKIILDSKDKKAWMQMLQKEEQEIGKEFLKIMDEEVKKADSQALDELRKTL